MVAQVFHTFKNCISDYNQSKQTSEALAGEALLSFVSFRLVFQNKWFAIDLLKVLVDTIRKLIKNGCYKKYSTNTYVAAMDTNYNDEQLRNEYTLKSLHVEINYYFSKEDVLIRPNIKVFTTLMFYSFKLFFYLLSVNKTKGKKLNYALVLKEFVEASCLLYQLKKHNVKYFIDYVNYEVDSNIFYLILNKHNIVVYKVPSPGGLSNHNKILLTDYLVISSGYQEEELEVLKNIKYNKLIKSYPEYGYTYLEKYLNTKPQQVDANKIGYYSHASWLRIKQQHADNGLNIDAAEEKTLQLLNELLKINANYHLTIFLHPREKKIDKVEVENYYSSILTSKQFLFANYSISTSNSFDEVDTVIIALSTILFERLFVGRKTFICNYKIHDFPITSSTLNNICFKTAHELILKMDESKYMNNNEFYDYYQIKNHSQHYFMGN